MDTRLEKEDAVSSLAASCAGQAHESQAHAGQAVESVESIRAHFPILSASVHGKALVYLDNAATTQLPAVVLKALMTHYCRSNGNVHRGTHALSQLSTKHYEGARASVARFINAPTSENVVFTSGTTQAINIVARALDPYAKGHDCIVVSALEHHSNLLPWQELCKRAGLSVVVAPLTPSCDLDLLAFGELLARRKPLLVACTHVSNVTGTVNPVKQMACMAHEAGALFLVDAAQSIRHELVDVQDIDCDFLCFSGHKICAPTGTGVLYGKTELLRRFLPVSFGGEMVDTASYQEFYPERPPLRFEPGTPNYAGAIALGAAVEYLTSVGRQHIGAYERSLVAYACDKLGEVQGVNILGSPMQRAGCVSFTVAGASCLDVALLMDAQGIAVRSGSLCAQPLLNKVFQVPGVVRVSPAFYNTFHEIDQCVEALRQTLALLA